MGRGGIGLRGLLSLSRWVGVVFGLRFGLSEMSIVGSQIS